MIDIHSHILPGVDDGPVNMEESILLAKLAVKEGVKTIFATPHHLNGDFYNSREEIISGVSKLNEVLIKENIPLTVLVGQELRVNAEILENYRQTNQIVTMNDGGKYLLVELPNDLVPSYFERVIYDIQLEGLIPIIVHPERNKELMKNPILLYNLVKKGALTQITAGSLIGKFGGNTRRFARQLIESDLTHFVASDAHNIQSRSFHLSAAMEMVKKKCGLDYLELFLYNAEQVASDRYVYKEIPKKPKVKKGLSLF